MKYISFIIISFSCSSDVKTPSELKSSFIENATVGVFLNGVAYASCGLCNFNLIESSNCELAIKVGKAVYRVEGSGIDDHGDAHAQNGLCNSIQLASITGKIDSNFFYAETFDLVNDN